MRVLWSLCVFLAMVAADVEGSAIPMWEYLSRGEKMGHLFNMFVQQVEKHCSQNAEPDCSKLLLVYGLKNLANMGDESLDDMDPYQRNANSIVWDSMMKGSEHSTTSRPGGEANDMLDDLELGEQSAGSSIHEETQPQSFLLGPMVVRVLPNGLPIPGEKNHLPKDEDVEEFTPSKFTLPTTSAPTTTTPPSPSTSTAEPPAQYKEEASNPSGNSRAYNNNFYRPPSYSNSGNYYNNQPNYYNPNNYNNGFNRRSDYNSQSGTFQVRSPMYTVYRDSTRH